MSRLKLALVLFACAQPVFAQQTIPARFQSLTKNDRFGLTRILGTPELQPLLNHLAYQTTAFSADGKRAIFVEDLSTFVDGQLQLRTRLLVWDTQTKGWPREIELADKNVSALALSADGARVILTGQVAVAKKEPPRIYLSLWDLNAAKAIHTIVTKEPVPFLCVALAPDESTVLTGSIRQGGPPRQAGMLKCWDLKNGKERASYNEQSGHGVSAAAYLPGGKQFLTGLWNGKLQLWNVNAVDKPVRVFEGKGIHSFVTHIAVSRDGKRFASGDYSFAVSLWDVGAGKELGMLRTGMRTLPNGLVTALALADDSKTVFSVWSKQEPEADDFRCARLIAWDGETDKIVWSHTVPYRGRVPMLVQGDKLLVGGGPNLFDVWNIADGKHLETWGGHKSAVSAVLADSTERLYSAGHDGNVHVWVKGQLVRSFAAHAEPILAMTLNLKQTHLFTASADKTVKIWNVITGKLQQTLSGHTGSVSAIVVGKDGKRAYTASSDRSIKIWDLDTGKSLATLTGHADAVNAIALSHGESWLATGSDDTSIRLWPIKNDKLDPDREAILLEQHKKAVTCLAFAPDGKTLLSGSQDNTVKVWDWSKGKVNRTLAGHKNWITSLAFADAGTLMTTSDDLSICRWNLETGKEMGRIDFGVIGDCPRCIARLAPDRFVVGTSSWMLFEFDTGKR